MADRADHAFQVLPGGRAEPAAILDEGSPTAARGLHAAVTPLIAAAAGLRPGPAGPAGPTGSAGSALVFAAPEDAPPTPVDALFEMRRYRSTAPYLTRRARGADVILLTPLIDEGPPTGGRWNRALTAMCDALSALGRRHVWVLTGSPGADIGERARAAGMLAHFACASDIRADLATTPEIIGDLAIAPSRFDTVIAPPGLGALIGRLLASVVGEGPLTPRLTVGLNGARFDAVPSGEVRRPVADIEDPCALIAAGAWLLRWRGLAHAADRLEGALDQAIAAGAHPRDRRHEGVNGRALETRDFLAEVRRRLTDRDDHAHRPDRPASLGLAAPFAAASAGCGPRLVWSRNAPNAPCRAERRMEGGNPDRTVSILRRGEDIDLPGTP